MSKNFRVSMRITFDVVKLETDNLKNGKFHQNLRDTFAPLVVRYVDLMETSIAQSIHKGFEKERWEIKGNGCATSEDLFWKLDALQSFIRGLHWPEAEFRQHLEKRLKLMACDMIESCIQRTDNAYQQWLKKSVTFISTDYIIPSEMCAMVNVILDAKNQSFKLCAVDGVDVVSETDPKKKKSCYHVSLMIRFFSHSVLPYRFWVIIVRYWP